MEPTISPQVDYRNFTLPICLMSLIFFNAYIIILSWILPMALQSRQIFIDPLSVQILTLILTLMIPQLAGVPFLLLSIIGSFLFLRELRAQSLTLTSGIPLCVLFGAITVPAIIFIFRFYSLAPFSNEIMIYSVLILLAGFMSLPYGVDYLLNGFRGTRFDIILQESHFAGLFGLVVSSGLIISVFLLTSTWIEDLIPVFLVAMLFGIFHMLIVMPIFGIVLFRFGLSLLRDPPVVIEDSGAVALQG